MNVSLNEHYRLLLGVETPWTVVAVNLEIDRKRVEIDLTDARIWDTSAVAALDTVVEKFAQRGIHAELVGMNEHAERLHTSTSGQVTAGH